MGACESGHPGLAARAGALDYRLRGNDTTLTGPHFERLTRRVREASFALGGRRVAPRLKVSYDPAPMEGGRPCGIGSLFSWLGFAWRRRRSPKTGLPWSSATIATTTFPRRSSCT